MRYVDINEAIEADGLRIVIVKAMPSAWGVAAKAMIEYKGLDFLCAHQIPMSDNPELLAWSGTNSGPVVAWNDEAPINRWNDILLLLERLQPEKPLVGANMHERMQVFGIGHEICGELGFGWNRRIDLIRPPAGEAVSEFGKKYSYRETEAALANERVVALMNELTAILKAQKAAGSDYLVGQSVTAADFYWAAFSNFVQLQPHEECPMNPDARPMFANTPAEIMVALDPVLLEHRDRIMRTYYKLPLEL
ncbi:MAG: glutathione binding-like protein [Gammaproteobacteria bacterium]